MSLNEDQKRHLRRLGHSLNPVVRTGNAGLTDAVMAEIELALDHHELIKVKLVAEREQRDVFREQILKQTGAQLVQAIGGIILIYRRNAKKKQPIALP